MTNRDKIKSMTSEEMAKLFGMACDICKYDEGSELCEENDCKKGVIEWLESEVEG